MAFNRKTGQLDPSIETLMRKLKRSRDSIVRALNALRAHGFLDWLRRYVPTGSEGMETRNSSHPVCHRSHGIVLRYPGPSRAALPDDQAFLIGPALGHVRQGDGLTGIVPDMVISRLQMHADTGNPACFSIDSRTWPCKPSPPQTEIISVLYTAPPIRGIAPEFAGTASEHCD